MKERIKRFVIEACCHFIVLTVSIEKTKLILYRYITQKGYLMQHEHFELWTPSIGRFLGKLRIFIKQLIQYIDLGINHCNLFI